MANTGRISGKDLYMTIGGVPVHGDFTSVTVSTEDDQIDVTAGADTYHYFLSLARQNGSIGFEAFYDGATTTVWDAILPGAAGTVIIGPKGTATGSPLWTWARALVQSRETSFPFDDGARVTATIQPSAALAETTY